MIIDGTNQLTFDGAGMGTVTVGGITPSSTASVGLTKSSPGLLQISGAPKLNAGSTLSVSHGTLEFNVASGMATIGPNVNATVANGATLQLAGTVSALSDGSAINPTSGNLVNIANSGSLTVTSAIGRRSHRQRHDGRPSRGQSDRKPNHPNVANDRRWLDDNDPAVGLWCGQRCCHKCDIGGATRPDRSIHRDPSRACKNLRWSQRQCFVARRCGDARQPDNC